MALDPSVLRELDPGERYYWLLDHLSCMVVAAVAELDRELDRDRLGDALGALQRRHALLRTRVAVVDGEPTFVAAERGIPVAEGTAARGAWHEELESELDTPFGDSSGPLIRCRYVAIDGEDRSVLMLVAHHAVADARALVSALQQLVRQLAEGAVGQAPDEATPSALPAPMHDRYTEELRSPRAMVDVTRQVRAERRAQPAPEDFAVHRRHVRARHTRLHRLTVDAAGVGALRAAARTAGATVHGVLSAALLTAGASLLEDGGEHTIMLVTPTDLRARMASPPPPDDVQLATGLLASPFHVGDSAAELASTISGQVHRELERRESHLFYRIVRAVSFPANDDGFEAFGAWMDGVPQALAMSNLGVVADEEDPPWLASLSFALAASPNQVAFAAATTYRGRLVMDLATDRAALAPEFADLLAAGLAERIGAQLAPARNR